MCVILQSDIICDPDINKMDTSIVTNKWIIYVQNIHFRVVLINHVPSIYLWERNSRAENLINQSLRITRSPRSTLSYFRWAFNPQDKNDFPDMTVLLGLSNVFLRVSFRSFVHMYQNLRQKRFVLISNLFSDIGFVYNSQAIKSLKHSDIIKMCIDKKIRQHKFSSVDSLLDFFFDTLNLVKKIKQRLAGD